jgi:NTP pyrophosphatase (non-canonical NTP hydrolase)
VSDKRSAIGTDPDSMLPTADDVRGVLRGYRANFESPTLNDVQVINDARRDRWHDGGSREWSVLEWAGAMCGEAGEAANVAKKLLRIELGLRGNEAAEHVATDRDELRAKLAGEIGGVVLYCALLASAEGIDFERAVVETFNAKSEAMGFPERL